MRKKLAILVTMLVMLLVAAAPALADTATAGSNNPPVPFALADSQFFGGDFGLAGAGAPTNFAVGGSAFFGTDFAVATPDAVAESGFFD